MSGADENEDRSPTWLRDLVSSPMPFEPSTESAEDVIRKQRDEQRLHRLRVSIPARYQWAKMSAPELVARVGRPDALAEAHAALESDRTVIIGPAGTGKTSLGVAMLRAWFRATHGDCLFVPAVRLGMARSQTRLGTGEPEIVDAALSHGLLLLDDLGAETDLPTSAVPNVIHERYDANRATWITTALTVSQVSQRYGTGVARRVFEGATVIDLHPRPVSARGQGATMGTPNGSRVVPETKTRPGGT